MGEGVDGDMADYGWIDNDETGRTVWEMTYRKTDHAGGAEKNRVCDDTILLKAGTYVVYFETDGSHSYGNWNTCRAAPSRKMGHHGLGRRRLSEEIAH